MRTASKQEIDREILKICEERGVNPAHLNESRYRQLSLLAYRRLGKAGKAIASATSSVARTKLGMRVSEEVREQNRQTCLECPHDKYAVLARDGSSACRACGCVGRMLEVKWMDPKEHCPLTVNGHRCDFMGEHSSTDPDDPPIWDNRGKEASKVIDTPADHDVARKVN